MDGSRRIRYVGLIRILLLPNGRRAQATIDEDASWKLVKATSVKGHSSRGVCAAKDPWGRNCVSGMVVLLARNEELGSCSPLPWAEGK